ncbi:MAG: SOS response-associated peptidase [Thermoflexales bacterium]
MCGRFTLTVPPEAVMAHFGLNAVESAFAPRYNIAPTQPVAVIFEHAPRVLAVARWGLMPSWGERAGRQTPLINARAETLHERPTFRRLLHRQRCLIPADGFYEWRTDAGGHKQPIRFTLQDGGLFAFAGLWDTWQNAHGQRVPSCVIITVPANSLIAPLHDRMPAMLDSEQARRWLSPSCKAPEAQALLKPYPAERMRAYAVSPRVNQTRFDDPSLIAPYEPPG